LRAVLSRTLLLEFVPAVERMNVEQLFGEAGILRVTPAVCAIAQIILFLASHLILIVGMNALTEEAHAIVNHRVAVEDSNSRYVA
jgi:hypothetical protein